MKYAVWLYFRFNLSHRDIEDLLARRGILVTHESIRLWCNKFGPHYEHRLRRRHCGYGDTLFIDEVFVRIQGRQRYLGARSTRTVRSSTYCSRSGETLHLPDDSSGACSRASVMSRERS